MTAWALYSEIDPFAAAWLNKLIAAGHIMPGVVDTRSLEDLTPDECREFTQVHLCAGIGVWSHALRLAGWDDNRACWTASFPCQPFSAAGKGAAFADERHIWPSGHWLIDQCRPPIVFGEQVASKDGLAWLDVVSADLEASGYAFGAADLCAAGVGAPHIRQRSYWLANRVSARLEGCDGPKHVELQRGAQSIRSTRSSGLASGLADTDGRDACTERQQSGWQHGQHPQDGRIGGVEQSSSIGRQRREATASGHEHDGPTSERSQSEHGCCIAMPSGVHTDGTGPTNGLWRDADWLYCRDGKWRPVEPRTFPLVARSAERMVRGGGTSQSIDANSTSEARVGRLRGYGNALCSSVATAFIAAVMECEL